MESTCHLHVAHTFVKSRPIFKPSRIAEGHDATRGIVRKIFITYYLIYRNP